MSATTGVFVTATTLVGLVTIYLILNTAAISSLQIETIQNVTPAGLISGEPFYITFHNPMWFPASFSHIQVEVTVKNKPVGSLYVNGTTVFPQESSTTDAELSLNLGNILPLALTNDVDVKKDTRYYVTALILPVPFDIPVKNALTPEKFQKVINSTYNSQG
ncbi:MAG: hypothetical protein ACREA3_02080 [Nitrosotalea sp.]